MPSNPPVVERRAADVPPDGVVDRLGRVQLPAGNGVRQRRAGGKRQRRRRLVAVFHVEQARGDASLEVDRRGRQARRGSCLQPSPAQAEAAQLLAEMNGRRLVDPAGWLGVVADVDQPVQEGPGGHDDGAAGQPASVQQGHTRCDAPLEGDGADVALDELDGGLRRKRLPDPGRVTSLVSLRPRRPHRRTAAAVEHLELDAGGVDRAAHQAAQGIDFADQLAFRGAADRRVARHRGDVRCRHRAQRHLAPQVGRRPRRLTAGMPGPDHDDIELHCLL